MGENVRYSQYGGKKMIVTCLSKRVTVYQDYKPHIDFNIDGRVKNFSHFGL